MESRSKIALGNGVDIDVIDDQQVVDDPLYRRGRSPTAESTLLLALGVLTSTDKDDLQEMFDTY
ncbi:hypothetical protein HAPAU_38720 [Halalkalicoccus paucihalophilus]|uniref:Uncharacterized protein n=1 Tax=Halalkalicoccus paucihalophilus TaxID=1008153 RepID=A0A151A850_9EURY|nr:hypothetical protein HAPAU_38720 [Halalkalicoccus paucihalophilus]